MKKGIAVLLTLLLLSGCTAGEAQIPAPEVCLQVLTPEQTLWEPFLQEFEYRTGIWIQSEQVQAEALSPEQAAEADLLLGYSPRQLQTVLPEERPRTVFYQVPVLIYNPHLIRKNLPTGFADLVDSRWQGNFAVEDPEQGSFAWNVMEILLQQNPQTDGEEVLRRFYANLAGFAETGESVADQVRDGTFAMGIVRESQIPSDHPGVSVVIPAEGSVLLPAAMTVPGTGSHPREAQQLAEFLLEEQTQLHGWESYGLRPGLETLELLPEDSRVLEEGRAETVRRLWNRIREGEK